LPIKKILEFEREKYDIKTEDISINTEGPWDKFIETIAL